MANNVTAQFPEIWDDKIQETFYNNNVARNIVESVPGAINNKGDTLHRVKRTEQTEAFAVTDRYADVSQYDVVRTDESLSINSEYVVSFRMASKDNFQASPKLIADEAENQAQILSDQIDSDVLGEIFNAASTVDAGNVGGSAGAGITLTEANVYKIPNAVTKKFQRLNVNNGMMRAVVSPDYMEIRNNSVTSRVTELGDKAVIRPYKGEYGGYDHYVSNLIAGSAVITWGATPTDGDIIVLEGQTFTAKTTLGSTAGNFAIGANAAAAKLAFETLVNDPVTTTATGVALGTTASSTVRMFINKISAVATSATLTTVRVFGTGVISISVTFASGSNTLTKQKQHLFFEKGDAPALAIQYDKVPDGGRVDGKYKVEEYIWGSLYGVKTFTDLAKRLVNVEIDASAL
jgi:hypothetical protein